MGSGALLGLFPARLINAMIGHLNSQGIAAVMFIHQWQLVDVKKRLWLFAKVSDFGDKGISKLRLRDFYSALTIRADTLEELFANHSFNRMDNLIA